MTFIIEAKMENDKIINSANISHNSVILFGTRDIAVTKTDESTCPHEAYILLREKAEYICE